MVCNCCHLSFPSINSLHSFTWTGFM
jgi:hypothetical protein